MSFPISSGGNLFFFLSTTELHKRMPLQQVPRFYIPLELTCCYSLPTALSSVTGNHTTDSFCLLKENFKNLLFGSLSRKELRVIYQVALCPKDDDSEE